MIYKPNVILVLITEHNNFHRYGSQICAKTLCMVRQKGIYFNFPAHVFLVLNINLIILNIFLLSEHILTFPEHVFTLLNIPFGVP